MRKLKVESLKLKVLVAQIAAVFIFSFLFFHFSFAQTRPAVWLTWRAETYVPTGYAGRAYASPGAVVRVSVTMIQNGKTQSLKNRTVKWFLNDELIQNGPGMDRTSFKAPSNDVGGLTRLTAQISDENGIIAGKTIQIAVASPEIVILAPYPTHEWSGKFIQLAARPFFFNLNDINELNINWKVNGREKAANDDRFNLTVSFDGEPRTGEITEISARASDINGTEAVSKTLKLKYKRR